MRKLLQCLALGAVISASLSAYAARGGASRETPKVQGVVNLNQADFDQLTLLPGVGPTKARRIVEWRAKHPFRRIEELTRVKGFGRKTFARLKAYLAVAGATTLQKVRLPTVGNASTAGVTAPTASMTPGARSTPPTSTRPTR
jgi:competence protein ComEA